MSADYVKVVNLKASLHAAELELNAARRSERTKLSTLELKKRMKDAPLQIERAEYAYKQARLNVELCEQNLAECQRRLAKDGRWV